MRKVDHGVTVDDNTFKMAEKIQANDATLRFLDALNFDADPEPGEAVVNTEIEEAIYIDERRAEGAASGRDRTCRRRLGAGQPMGRPGRQGASQAFRGAA